MTAIDRTPAGQKHVLPGAGPASDVPMARRAADAPLRARVPQRPCDIGLFSDEAAQVDLIQPPARVRSHRRYDGPPIRRRFEPILGISVCASAKAPDISLRRADNGGYPDLGELAADRWNETNGDRGTHVYSRRPHA